MTTRQAPAPFVPKGVDLRDFQFMPLYGDILFDSETWLLCSFEEKVAALSLWWKAWHQLPAGSLPSDDRLLSALAGYGVAVPAWKAVRDNAMRGWVLCSDGRFYHRFLAARALTAWEGKLARQGRIVRRLEMESGEWEAIRTAVFQRDDFTCRYCGDRGGKLECDHVVPVSCGGRTELQNLVTACFGCNRSKGAKLPGEWLQ